MFTICSLLQSIRSQNLGSGKQKMEWVIGKARGLLPGWLQTFVTDEVILRIIQGWFTAVKDLLDDGKYNNSTK